MRADSCAKFNFINIKVRFIITHNYKYNLDITSAYFTPNDENQIYTVVGLNPYYIDLFRLPCIFRVESFLAIHHLTQNVNTDAFWSLQVSKLNIST